MHLAHQNRAESVKVRQILKAAELATALDAGSLVKRYLSDAESQLLQDLFCVIATQEKKDGFFIEVGVGDGRHISNTYMLEKRLGWRGILVEPNRSFKDSIERQRDAQLIEQAATSRTGDTIVFEEESEGVFSGLASFKRKNDRSQSSKRYNVKSITLDKVLEESGAPRQIDYLSIDTEGSELDILAGLSIDRYEIGCLSIEHNYVSRTLRELDLLLCPSGYTRVLSEVSEFDAWYVRSDSHLLAVLDT
ncbi:MAG: FkbM family methyltransferase [Myxococcota bacterium]